MIVADTRAIPALPVGFDGIVSELVPSPEPHSGVKVLAQGAWCTHVVFFSPKPVGGLLSIVRFSWGERQFSRDIGRLVRRK